MNRIVSSLPLSSLIWISAFVSALFFIEKAQLQQFVAAVVLTMLWALMSFAKGTKDGWQVPKSGTLRLAGLFWLLAAFSVVLSPTPMIALTGFCFFSVMPLTFFALTLNYDEQAVKIITAALAIIFAGLSVWAMVQFFMLNDYVGGRAKLPLADPNALAALFNLALFPAMAGMIAGPTKIVRTLSLLLAILLAGGIMMTGSRGALLSALLVFAVFVWLNRSELKAHAKCIGLVIMAALIFFGLTTLGGRAHETMMDRTVKTVTGTHKDWTTNHADIWRGAWKMAKDHPVTGTGIGTFYLHYSQYRVPEDNFGAVMAHADPLQFAAEMGFAAPLLFYAFLIAAIIRTSRTLKKIPPENAAQRLLIIGPLCGLAAVVAHAHVTFAFYNLSILLGAGFLLAVWFTATRTVLNDEVSAQTFPPSWPNKTRVITLAVPFLVLGALFTLYTASEYYADRAQKNMFAGDVQGFADDLILAKNLSLGTNYRIWLRAANIPMSVLQQNGRSFPEEKKKELYAQATADLARARSRNPASSSAVYYQGYLQTLVPKDMVPEGTPPPEEFYREALRLDPLHIGARLALADIYQGRGDNDEALKIIEGGLNYYYHLPTAMDLYGRALILYSLKKDAQGQRIVVKKMADFQRRLERTKKKEATSLPQELLGQE